MKIIQARRERSDRISKIMGDYLLKGYKMLGSCCDDCAVSNANMHYHDYVWFIMMCYKFIYTKE